MGRLTRQDNFLCSYNMTLNEWMTLLREFSISEEEAESKKKSNDVIVYSCFFGPTELLTFLSAWLRNFS